MSLINKTVLITGGYGFLGRAVYNKLKNKCLHVHRFSLDECDLTKEEQVNALFERINPDIVVHCASLLGSIQFMSDYCGEIFYKNTLMNLYITEYSRKFEVEKLISIGSASVYSPEASIPYREEELWLGEPEETIKGYAFTKKIQVIQQQMYKKQYDFRSVHLILANLYGPNYNFSAKNLHVIPAMIKKIYHAKVNNIKEVTFWGSGNQTREFLYEDDAATAVLLSIDSLNTVNPINIGSSEEVSLKYIASQIANSLNYDGAIKWDITKPEGSKRRKLCLENSSKNWAYKAETKFVDGLKKTIATFLEGVSDE